MGTSNYGTGKAETLCLGRGARGGNKVNFQHLPNDRTVCELKHAPDDFYDPSALHLLENQQRISNHEQLCSKF